MRVTFYGWWLWIGANILGIVCFLYLAVPTWVEPELANEPGASSGESVVWAFSALPILVIGILMHLPMGFVAYSQRKHRGT